MHAMLPVKRNFISSSRKFTNLNETENLINRNVATVSIMACSYNNNNIVINTIAWPGNIMIANMHAFNLL